MSHYFETPDTIKSRHLVSAEIWGRRFDLLSSSGVFSGRRIDPGTAVLLRLAGPPDRSSGRFLDLGCGYGPIALALAAQCPGAVVDAVDTNEQALQLTAENAGRLGLAGRVRALRPGEADPTTRYDEIWSNPPIRIGKAALHDLMQTWLGRLADTGRATLVMGRHLGADSFQAWLREAGFAVTRIGSSQGFRVLRATRLP